ncbi:hypothetical protein ACWEOW_16360 [Monashia sp. NPDC004114]
MSEPPHDEHVRTVPVHHDPELRRDALTMALYVAIGLIGALSLFDTTLAGTTALRLVETIWGITLGLVLAHVFAFVVAAHVAGEGSLRRHDGEAAVAHLVGGLAVAIVATLAVLLVPESAELRIVRLVLAAFIGAVGYLVRRSNGASVKAALLFGFITIVLALIVAQIKVNLSH